MSFRRRMSSVPLSQITLTDPFWSGWQKTVIETTLPQQFEQLVATNRIANFELAAGRKEGAFEGLRFNDSDVYKFLEACAYSLAVAERRPELKAAADRVRGIVDTCIDVIGAAQMPDGYINTYFQLGHPSKRWLNLNAMHEMYSGGHLIEAGVALFECTGDRPLLDIGIRFADHVMSVFGPDTRRGYCGHQEIELALVRLAAATGEAKYADFANWMVEERGHAPSVFEAELGDPESVALAPEAARLLIGTGEYCGDYCQDHAPIREHTEVVGHAVRAMYYYIAAADLAADKGDSALEEALERVWSNLINRRMYVTAGIGPSASNEGFTGDFDLPNLTAYAETCASIGLVFWGHKMLELTGNSDYADVLERALYNGALSGISLSGDRYFYTNPLESRGSHQRVPWFLCACCPPNIARLIGNLAHYAVGASSDTLYLHVPVGFEADVELGGGPVHLSCKSNYPWSGEMEVIISPDHPRDFAVAVRIPGWADDVSFDIENAVEEAEYQNGYAVFRRTWQAGDKLKIEFEMEPKWIEADPRVRDNLGRAALMRGPLVYCAEQHDVTYTPQLFMADTEAPVELGQNASLGVTTMVVEGACEVELFPEGLYAEVGATDVAGSTATYIPFYAWNNRGATNMQVWTRKL
ncbi:MAG: glycoside hydrolase family 127 protein [Fimbriimonas sp.]